MTVSSIVVQVKPEYLRDVVNLLIDSDLCDYHLDDGNNKIIITVEGEGTEQEILKLKEIQKFSNVISAEMMYSYSEDELEKLKDNLDDNVPEWLNDPNIDAKDIKYKGDLKKHF